LIYLGVLKEPHHIGQRYSDNASDIYCSFCGRKGIGSLSGFDKVIYAPNIHTGGGEVLLVSLLELLQEHPNTLYIFDERMELPLSIKTPQNIIRIKHSFFSRLIAEIRLSNDVGDSGTVLCLGNLPPFFSVKADVVLFIQNRLLVDKEMLKNVSFLNRAKIMIQRMWLKYRNNSVQRVIVQTRAMQNLTSEAQDRQVDVLPFFDINSLQHDSETESVKQKYDYIYVASGDPHKNHRNLILAWVELAKRGYYPSLCLTLKETSSYKLVSWISYIKEKYQLNIYMVGEIAHKKIQDYYRASSALIYPSYTESFGLPLIEAASIGMPILASKLSYVHDVVEPTLTFDPNSPDSIMSAVMLNANASAKLSVKLVSPKEFISNVFG